MDSTLQKVKKGVFHSLKITKKEQLTKSTFSLELEIPEDLKGNFAYQSGQYVTLCYTHQGELYFNDYSMTGLSLEPTLNLAIKVNDPLSSTQSLDQNYPVGSTLEVSEPKGRFTLESKPHEFRTIVAFASGIGITPILSHFKFLLKSEPRTRLFLFYGNRTRKEVAFKEEIETLKAAHRDRFEVHYFYSREKIGNGFVEGRIDAKKVHLIINQIMMIDDTDEESTLWDAVDHVLICGKGEMIKSIARACYENGIPKKQIHFELFEEFNDDIYPVEVQLPHISPVHVKFLYNGQWHQTQLESNKNKLLQSLSVQKFSLPFSCKSGICGSCQCKLVEGEVELLENEYLTQSEEDRGQILACMSYALNETIVLDFDQV